MFAGADFCVGTENTRFQVTELLEGHLPLGGCIAYFLAKSADDGHAVSVAALLCSMRSKCPLSYHFPSRLVYFFAAGPLPGHQWSRSRCARPLRAGHGVAHCEQERTGGLPVHRLGAQCSRQVLLSALIFDLTEHFSYYFRLHCSDKDKTVQGDQLYEGGIEEVPLIILLLLCVLLALTFSIASYCFDGDRFWTA